MHNLDLILTLAGGFTAALVLGYLTQRARPLAHRRLPARRDARRSAHARLRGQRRPRRAVRRGRRHPPHVRRRPAVPHRGAAGGAARRHPGRDRAERRRDRCSAPSIARCFGWSWPAGIVFGMALSVASTVVLIRVLADHRDLHTPTGTHRRRLARRRGSVHGARARAAAGRLRRWRIGDERRSWRSAVTALKVAALVGFTIVVGTRVIPWRARPRRRHRLARAVHAHGARRSRSASPSDRPQLFGVSMALGAFLAGMVVGRSEFSLRAASDALPMRDAFAVLFFVSVGMLLPPASSPRSARPDCSRRWPSS